MGWASAGWLDNWVSMVLKWSWAGGGDSGQGRVSPVPLLFFSVFIFLFLFLASNFIFINQSCVSNSNLV